MPGPRIEILERIQKEEALPPLAPVAVRLIETASEDTVSADQIARVIQQDPSLTTRFLKVVNSPYFAPAKPISTLSQAVVIMGLKRVRILALSISLRHTFPFSNEHVFDYERFWRMSLYRGMLARRLVQAAGWKQPDPEEAFVAGLILEIGRLMLFRTLPEEWKSRYPSESVPESELLKWEQDNLKINHREVGRLILRKWRFPKALVETQRPDCNAPFEEQDPALCRVIETARSGAEILFGRSEELFRFQQTVQSDFGLGPHAVEELFCGVMSEVDELSHALELEARSALDLLEVMERANQALSRLNGYLEEKVQWFLEHHVPEEESPVTGQEAVQQERDRAVEAALQAVAHEIRNPLTALSGFARRLSKTLPQDEKSGKYLDIIVSESARLERVLEDLNQFSRAYVPEFREHDLRKLVGAVLDRLKQRFEEKKIVVQVEMDPEIPSVVLDAKGIAQVILRFIANSTRSMDQGGTVKVVCEYEGGERKVKLMILDTGKPLPPEAMAELMNPILTTRSFGSGLGIPMARKILAIHGGDLLYSRLTDLGNKAEIVLPVRPPENSSEHSKEGAHESAV